ncbi:MAG: DsbA family protein [Natronospirillum sp.]|uniref:DsbA family protein n=1 Tax=Natronospirillum sp. TaxID=2812955 RepID=UPI0025F90480|nr:DsbA family protein [Natronospirillum sp.]MCH8551453.1 DsbA family protein [Natronospirillum sp.]
MKPVRLVFLALLALLLTACATPSAQDTTTSGTQAQPGDYRFHDTDRDEVMVFFGYQCGPCHAFYEQQLTHWLDDNSETVTLLVPVLFDPSVEAAARGFHTAQLMGANPDFHRSVFAAYQADPARVASDEQVIAMAASCCDLDQEAFRDMYHSEAVQQRMDQAEALIYGHGIQATPAVLINREQVVTPNDVRPGEFLIDVVDAVLQGGLPPGRAI